MQGCVFIGILSWRNFCFFMPSLLGKVLTYLLKFNKVPKAPIDIMDGPSAELNRNFSKHCGFRVTKHPFNSSGVFFFRGGRTLMPFSLVPYPTRLRLVSMHLYCSFYRVQALDFTYVMQKCLHLGACVQILNNKLRLFRELPLIPKPTLYKNNLISLPKLTGVRAFCANFKQTGLLAGVSVHKLKHTPLRFVVSNEGNRLRGILVGSSKDVGVNTRGDRPESLVLTEVPASSLAAMFGYTRRYQKTPFIRLSLFKHFRRYFLVLDQLTLNLTLKGVMRQFKVYFKTLNTPLNQIIKNPVTNQWILDFVLNLSSENALDLTPERIFPTVRALLEESLLEANVDRTSAYSEEYSSLQTLAAELARFFCTSSASSKLSSGIRGVTLYRYKLTWEQIFFQKIVSHGLIKKKKARSIKRRRTKRLIKKTKYRFWAL